MSASTTTRRDLLRFGTSAAAYAAGAAIVTGGVALASEAKGATGVSPELLRLIAAADRAEAEAAAYNRNVYDPARDHWHAVDAATPHVEVAGFAGAIWSTGDKRRVANARMWTSKPRHMSNPGAQEEYAAMQRFVAAHDERQAHVDKTGNRDRYYHVHDEDEQNNARAAEAMDWVADFPPATIADLRVKLAYMVDRGMGNGMDWLPELLTDVKRLSGGEVA